MKVLVTGASGFLGGALARALAQDGVAVRVLARATSRLEHLEGLPVEVAYGTLLDPDSLRPAVADVHTLYHCAGLSADWGAWDNFYRINVEGVRALLAVAEAAGVQRFLHVSTSDVYGYPPDACDETHPLTDIGLPYNRSKVLGEQAVWDYHTRTGLPVTVVRPVSIYGPRSKDFVAEIATLLYQRQMLLVNGGRSHAGLLYIDNAVTALRAAATSPHTVGQAYNLRDVGDVTWREYITALADGLGTPRPRLRLAGGIALALARGMEWGYRGLRRSERPLLTRHAVYLMTRSQGYAIAKAQRDFGLASAVSFAEGVARSVVWLGTEEGRRMAPR